jgi:hypothetical protein
MVLASHPLYLVVSAIRSVIPSAAEGVDRRRRKSSLGVKKEQQDFSCWTRNKLMDHKAHK